MLRIWIKVSKSGFDEIKSKITEGKEKKIKNYCKWKRNETRWCKKVSKRHSQWSNKLG